MKPIKKLILILVGVALITTLISLILAKNFSSQSKADNREIMFYGDTCPHCIKVEEFVAQNQIEQKFSFEKLEVFNNKDNASKMVEYAYKCGLSGNAALGVPLFWDGSAGKCYQGDVDIINLLKTKAQIN